jgi:hypothetical protein
MEDRTNWDWNEVSKAQAAHKPTEGLREALQMLYGISPTG